MYRKGSGEANVRFHNPIPLAMGVEDSNEHSGQRTASPERQFSQLTMDVEDSNKHFGQRAASTENQFAKLTIDVEDSNKHFGQRTASPERRFFQPTMDVEDPNNHFGQRTASPERQFGCDGWCRTWGIFATPEYGDVVCWVSSHHSIPRVNSLVFRRYPSPLPTTAKFLGMQVQGTEAASR